MKVIEFREVWEKYHIKFIQEKQIFWEEFWVLEDINLEINKGEVLGIIGENGAGKTTLLKLIAGMLVPDRGKVYVEGKVSALMELGAGFNLEFTGRENIILNARMYGVDEDLLEKKLNEIIEFAGLGKFIDAPIKYYSQGMYMRLAFALAIYVEPDILLIDDILAVGDEEAQQRCIKKIFQLKQTGKTIVVVSHDMDMIEKLCDQVILLEKGKIVQRGSPREVIPRYLEVVGDKKGIAVLEKENLRIVFNNGRIIISYGGITLTRGMGGYVSFFNPLLNAWLSSLNLDWQLREFYSDGIIAEGLYQDGAIAQIWVIQIQKNQLQWQVEIKDNSIKEPHIDLLLIPDYTEWVSLERNGEFGTFVHKSNWHKVGLDDYPDDIIGIRTDLEEKSLPFLTLEIENKEGELKLLNTGYNQEARVIQSYLLGNYISLKIKVFSDIDIFEEYIKQLRSEFLLKQQKEQAQLQASRTITSGDLYLFADLEKKSLRLYYKDKELTKLSGLHISFLFNQAWYDTSVCDWQVEKQTNTLVLDFNWKQLQFSSTCKFSLKDNCLFWQADFNLPDSFKLDLLKFGLLIIPEYKSFFAAHQEGDFPGEFTSWQDISLEEPKAELFGLRKSKALPAIVLENNHNFSCIIQNSDFPSSCRCLQLSLPKQTLEEKRYIFFSTCLRLIEEETVIIEYIKERKQRLFLRQQKEQAQLQASRTITSGDLYLFADLEKKSLRLYYKDKEITTANGLCSIFNVSRQNFWLLPKDAQWQLQKFSDKKMSLTLYYELVALSQIWTLICKEENILEFQIELKADKPLFLISQYVRLELTNKYENWLTAYEYGDFSNTQYINNIFPIRLRNNKISKIILKSQTKDLPQLFFEVTSQINKWIFGIHKQKSENGESICLNYSLIIPRKEAEVSPGEYTYFKGNIILNKNIKLEELPSEENFELNRGDLKFVFDRGRGKILWGERELTSGLGVYTSVRSLGIWYDSSQAHWQINKKEDSKIVVSGDWPYIPLSQVWQIELIDKNSIFWKVDMEIYGEINLEIEQANLMLSSEYRIWTIGSIKGEFSDEYTQDYDIFPFRFWYGKSKKIEAISDGLPSILFICNSKDESFRGLVENSDYLYRTRLLQYQRSNVTKLLPKKYTYFEGVIKIVAKE